MKINTKNRLFKKPVIAGVTILAVMGIGYGIFAYTNNPLHFNREASQAVPVSGVNYDEPTNAQKQAGEDKKKSTAIPNPDTNPNTPAGNSTTGSNLGVTITALNQNGGQIQVRSLIEAISSNGTCTLTLTNGVETVTKTSGIQALPSSSTCKGFDVPTSELSQGTWQVTVIVTVDSSTGSSTKAIVLK